ncbi:MAG: hypothetical protein U0746_02240 [Gemmataceae bacterium]
MDATPLRQIKPDVLKAAAHLYEPVSAVRWRNQPTFETPYSQSARRFVGTNPPRGAHIYYSFAEKPKKASLKIVDYTGASIRELPVKLEAGLHRVVWDMTRLSARPAIGLATGEVPPEAIFERQGGVFSAAVPPGMYRVVLSADGKDLSQPLRIEADPVIGTNAMAAGDESEDDEEP